MCCKREMAVWVVYHLPLLFSVDEVSDQEEAFDKVTHKQLMCQLQHMGGEERLTEKLLNRNKTKGKNTTVKKSNERSSAGPGVGTLALFADIEILREVKVEEDHKRLKTVSRRIHEQ